MTQKNNNIKIQKVNVKIDGKGIKVPEDSTVLQATKDAGIYIPTLCHLENTTEYGGCRLCMVEIKNYRGYPTACTTPVSDNMEVSTKTPELQKLRKNILELLLSEHPYTCLVCKDKGDCTEYMHTTRKVSVTTGCNFCSANGLCELQDLVDYLELKEVNFPIEFRNVPADNDNPFYKLDYNLCILCGRCIRACNDLRNSGVLSFVKRGNTSLVGVTFGETQQEAGCEYCGACVDVCPTGSIAEKMGSWVGYPEKSVETTCVFCSVGCTMKVNKRGNRIINVGPEPGNKSNPIQLCVRGKFMPGDLAHHPDRITQPLIKKGNKWIEATWDEAITFTANNLERYRGNQFGMIGSAQDSIESNYIWQKFTRKVMRSNNVDLLSSHLDKELMYKIHDHYRTFSRPEINEIPEADTILAIGTNTSDSHPIIEKNIRAAYKNNRKVIAANSFNNRTWNFSNNNILYNVGEEYNFLLLIISELVKNNKSKVASEIKIQLKEFDTKTALKQCGIDKKDVETFAKSLGSSKKLYILAGNGLFKSPDCKINFKLLQNIQQLVKNPDDCKLMFLFEEGNRLGATMAGMHPDYLGGFSAVGIEKNIKKWSDIWNVNLSNIPGISANEMLNKVAEDGITTMYIVGNIPHHPKLADLKFLVQHNMFMTETSEYANVVFPMPFFAETEGHIINTEGELKKVVPVIDPQDDMIEPWKVIRKIAQLNTEKGFNYKRSSDILAEISKNIDLSLTGKEKQKKKLSKANKVKLNGRESKTGKFIRLDTSPFNYHGNFLSSLVPDMKIIREEGILFISNDLARQLKLKKDEPVSINTDHGSLRPKIKISADLEGEIAYIKPLPEQHFAFTSELNLDNTYISFKIEKV